MSSSALVTCVSSVISAKDTARRHLYKNILSACKLSAYKLSVKSALGRTLCSENVDVNVRQSGLKIHLRLRKFDGCESPRKSVDANYGSIKPHCQANKYFASPGIMAIPPHERPYKNMNKQVAEYTYDSSRLLNALVPIEVEKKEIKEVKVSDLVVGIVREARGDESWKEPEVRILREAAKLEVVHLFRKLKGLKEETEVGSDERKKINKLLKDVAGMRDDLVLEILKGKSVAEAFRVCCNGVCNNNLLFEDSEIAHAL